MESAASSPPSIYPAGWSVRAPQTLPRHRLRADTAHGAASAAPTACEASTRESNVSAVLLIPRFRRRGPSVCVARLSGVIDRRLGAASLRRPSSVCVDVRRGRIDSGGRGAFSCVYAVVRTLYKGSVSVGVESRDRSWVLGERKWAHICPSTPGAVRCVPSVLA